MLKYLKNTFLSPLRRLQRNYTENSKSSHAQCGEDLILQYLFDVLGLLNVTYLDIGAHHPTYLSNTYLFYKNGHSGVCIEPDPSLYTEFIKQRPRDINLNCGVGVTSGEADFFIMSTSTLNTFSREEAERYQSYGKQQVIKTIQVQLISINEIIMSNFKITPDLVSLDVEGLDFVILQNFDFDKYRPKVFCLETLSYTEDKSERKLTEIIDLMHDNGYMTYADTYINTIFVAKEAWNNRP